MVVFLLLFNFQVFEVVVWCKSFVLVVVELYLIVLVVSYQVVWLEFYFGICFFECSVYGVCIIMVGESYLVCIQGVILVIMVVFMDVWQGVSNMFYIYFVFSIVSLWLMVWFNDFVCIYLEIIFNFLVVYLQSNFELGEVDIDICYGIFNWLGLVVELFFEECIVLLVSLVFICEYKFKKFVDLLGVKFICSNVSVVQWLDWFGEFVDVCLLEQFVVCFDCVQMLLDVVIQGLGVVLESVIVVVWYIEEKKLKLVFGLECVIKVKVYFVVYLVYYVCWFVVVVFFEWLCEQVEVQDY